MCEEILCEIIFLELLTKTVQLRHSRQILNIDLLSLLLASIVFVKGLSLDFCSNIKLIEANQLTSFPPEIIYGYLMI